MNKLMQTVMTLTICFLMSFGAVAHAQKGDKKPPPKDKIVVDAPEKKPPPRDDKKKSDDKKNDDRNPPLSSYLRSFISE